MASSGISGTELQAYLTSDVDDGPTTGTVDYESYIKARFLEVERTANIFNSELDGLDKLDFNTLDSAKARARVLYLEPETQLRDLPGSPEFKRQYKKATDVYLKLNKLADEAQELLNAFNRLPQPYMDPDETGTGGFYRDRIRTEVPSATSTRARTFTPQQFAQSSTRSSDTGSTGYL